MSALLLQEERAEISNYSMATGPAVTYSDVQPVHACKYCDVLSDVQPVHVL